MQGLSTTLLYVHPVIQGSMRLIYEKSSLELAEKEFDRLCRVNIKSLYFSAKIIAPCIQKQGGGGVFINISSISALRPRPNLVWYAASKGAASAVC
jgi:3-oxoacyl-[acyl-carrier protein] reductase